MTIDLTGGLDPGREYVFAERPDDPEMRDSASFWVFDDRGELGLPRSGSKRSPPTGRRMGSRQRGLPRRPRLPPAPGRGGPVAPGPRGAAERARCGPAQLPVRRTVPDVDHGLRGPDGPDLVVRPGQWQEGTALWSTWRFEVEATMATPPWIQGELVEAAGSRLKTSIEGDLMGGER